MSTDDEIEDLNTEWIDNFNKIDEEFKNYYCEDLTFIKINYVYINSINEIDMVKEEKHLLKKVGTLSKEELLQIIKQNCFVNGQKYSLLGILKYNIDIEPKNIKQLFKFDNNNNNFVPYFSSVKNIDSIAFEKSIAMFHDINQIFILFHQLICLPNNNNNNNKKIGNYTKKVFIYLNSNKKTRRKLYKETSI